jgi:pyruvate dehydrogenase E2 component (dihydrolipoamide acetyltransferase)
MADFLMPSLGADMEAAILVEWHVHPGDAVKRGEIIAEVETEKGIIEIECFTAGTVQKLCAKPGDKLPVGALMAVIQSAGETAAPTAPLPAPKPAEPPRVRASPLAKTVAAELGIDLTTVTGTGTGGAIERTDVERAAAAKQVPAAAPPAQPTSATPPSPAAKTGDSMRRAIAAAMAKSKREIPHYYLQTRIDMTAALAWLTAENARRSMPDRLLPAVLLLKGLAAALRDVPELNGYWIDGEHRISDGIHIGFAIAMKGGGLIAPAIHDVDRKSPDEIMSCLRDLIPRARSGRLRSSEMTDATITLTSLGDLGVESVFGVIYPPQVAIVGCGRILEQPWAKDGMLGAHPVMNVTLSGDHRATDGHRGAQLLDAFTQHLQNP